VCGVLLCLFDVVEDEEKGGGLAVSTVAAERERMRSSEREGSWICKKVGETR
jgi:hypothetical protein